MGLRLLIAFGIIVLLIGVWRGESSLTHSYHLRRSAETLRQHIDQLTIGNKRLAAEIDRLRNSPSYAQKILRDRYHLVEDDEDIVFFAD
ncbi:MAG: septum formation initiator family protein [Pseudomonadota bacterium]|nr:septum formation initiator family protein [Pseudomonadota bacterium]